MWRASETQFSFEKNRKNKAKVILFNCLQKNMVPIDKFKRDLKDLKQHIKSSQIIRIFVSLTNSFGRSFGIRFHSEYVLFRYEIDKQIRGSLAENFFEF